MNAFSYLMSLSVNLILFDFDNFERRNKERKMGGDNGKVPRFLPFSTGNFRISGTEPISEPKNHRFFGRFGPEPTTLLLAIIATG